MMRSRSWTRTVSVTFLALLFCSPAAGQEQLARTFSLNAYNRVFDGHFQGIRYASDGNVYFGSSTHSPTHGAGFFKYDPRTNAVTMLAEDITPLCGDDPLVSPHGKLHSDIVEANGWLYFSTDFSSHKEGAYENFSGSCVLSYELATGAFRNYGVIVPRYTSYAGIGVDPVRNYIYVFLTGHYATDVSYVYRIHAITGEKTNLGQVGGAFANSFYFYVDRRGDVWFSVSSQGSSLFRVRGETGVIEQYPDALPPMYRWDVNQLSADQRRSIMWMQPLDGDRALLTLANGGMLYLFDSTKPIGSGQEFQALQHIGYTDLGLAIGGNRVFYYQRANRGYGVQGFTDYHLLSVSLDAAAGYPISDHGLLKDQDGRLLFRAPAMATDGHHRVFMGSDWWTLPGDLGTLRYHDHHADPNEIAGPHIHDQYGDSYFELPRGQFFAVADVTIDETTPSLTLLTLTPNSVVGGASTTTNSVGLTAPAFAGGHTLTLSSSDPAVAAPPSEVVVPAGSLTANFTITTAGVAANQQVTITASDSGGSRTVILTVAPAVLSSVDVSPAANAGTPVTTNTITLTGAAPAGGASVALSSSHPALAAVAATVVVSASTNTASFTINTSLVTVSTTVTITATYGGVARTDTLTILPLTISALTVSPSSVDAGTSTTLNRVTLNRPAPPGGASVSLSSNYPGIAGVPTAVVVSEGETSSPTFTIATNPIAVSKTVTISASYGGVTRSGPLTIAAVTPGSVSLSPTGVDAGTASTSNRVVLTRPAPPGGALVTLASSNPAAAAVPDSVVVPQAATNSPNFIITTGAVTTNTSVNITATYAGVARASTLTVYAVTLSALSVSPTSANAGSPTATNRVVLNRPAPPGGAVVALSSSRPGVAAVPDSVLVPAGTTTSPYFTITTNAVVAATPVTITAIYGGVTRTAALTVMPVTLGTLTLTATSIDAGSSTTTNRVALTRVAPPGGAVVALSSSHPGLAAVPTSIVVPAGTTQSPVFTISTSPVPANTAVTITASFGGVTRTAALTIYAVTLSSLTLSPTSVNAGTPLPTNRVALTRPAPAGGALVTLSSSNPSAASVPNSVTAAAGTTTSPYFSIATYPVLTTTTVTITASFGGVTRTATLTIYPVTLQRLSLYPASVKGGASTAYNSAILNRAAPPGGATVTLSSSNPSLANVQASVVVPAGNTASGMFTITTAAVTVSTQVIITASFGGVSSTIMLTLTP